MKIRICLNKLVSVLKTPVEYYLTHSKYGKVFLNTWLGKSVLLSHTGSIHCIRCKRETNKSFQQGFCYPCLRRLWECNFCIIRPECCRIEKGECPVDDWAHAHCHKNHIVYLANSAKLKVGITQTTQVPTRWIDQGAIQAVPMFQTKNRFQAGTIEVVLKSFVADRTDWRRMLQNDIEKLDLISEKNILLKRANFSLSKTICQFSRRDIYKFKTTAITQLSYPVLQYPSKIQVLSLEKTPVISGTLLGIKGQYLILNTGIFNVRKYCGYNVECIVL
ncbi:DUF2797 domain-containing protein [Coxiella endosymbiont of Amblyomma sculptum]|uniref:DUF2797 domain-containing protein n=1 Tax=Coxiella endosymbiont of Amblyomma sculptum TaxID=2487929 RepID=UPI00132F1C73|nr:DUF2797 domain-containing protein [Coxiella endosymbiont of Amblyomma sculptum]QHG92611.1 DUF2797 domain-containing protein [Coxiella endosymbiont of Amblyomma sculptum]